MITESCSSLRLPSFDARVFTKTGVVNTVVSSSGVLCTDDVQSCFATLSGYV